jgi:hypothetical protein
MNVLCKALELKADEFGEDVKTSMLYELGEARSKCEGVAESEKARVLEISDLKT